MKSSSSSDILRFPKMILLMLICSVANFLGTLLSPALPALTKAFQVTPSVAAITMSIFLIGYCIGQLPYGPIGNRFGRKKAFYIGMSIALCGNLLGYFADTFPVLCFARFLQAVGASAGLVSAFTIIGDLHAGAAAKKSLATMSFAFGIIPGFATTIGGFVTVFAGWQSCFLVLSLYIVILWFFARKLPETAPRLHFEALKFRSVIEGYYAQFKNPHMVLCALQAGLTTASMYIFITLAPYIGINQIGLLPDTYGLLGILPSAGLFTGALISRALSEKDHRIAPALGIFLFIFAASGFTYFFARSEVTVWTLFVPAIFMYMGNNLIWSNALAQGQSRSDDKSNASAVLQFINLAVATVGVFVVQALPSTNPMTMPFVFWIIAALSLILMIKLKAFRKHPG